MATIRPGGSLPTAPALKQIPILGVRDMPTFDCAEVILDVVVGWAGSGSPDLAAIQELAIAAKLQCGRTE
jgi:hypothetical protein